MIVDIFLNVLICIVENNSVDDIMKKIDVINRFIAYFKFNVNVSLFLDNFVISLEER